MKFKIGDIVEPTEGSTYVLRCGSGAYRDAVIVSIEPFVLVSRETDMLWNFAKNEEMKITGTASNKLLKNCTERYERYKAQSV